MKSLWLASGSVLAYYLLVAAVVVLQLMGVA